ncbi:MAG TPA: DedA family protein [Ruania sp.]|nr:DedA family protein [Ruania sp.]
METLLAHLGENFGPLMLLIGGLVAFAESALGLGFVFPGETAVLTLGAAAGSAAQVAQAVLVVAIGASAGDHLGYLIGRAVGPRLRQGRLIRRIGVNHWDRAEALLDRHGLVVLVISRLLPVIRTIVPAVVGAGGLAYRRFLLGSVLGAMAWSALWVGLGATARMALPELVQRLGLFGGLALAVVAIVVIVLVVRYRRTARA